MISEISTKKASISQLTEQKSSKLSIYKKEESKVEEIKEKLTCLQDQYEENMRGINEKLESKIKKIWAVANLINALLGIMVNYDPNIMLTGKLGTCSTRLGFVIYNHRAVVTLATEDFFSWRECWVGVVNVGIEKTTGGETYAIRKIY